MNTKRIKTIRRQKRTRAKVVGTQTMPRLSIHRTNKYMYAQLINDETHKTILGISEKHLETQNAGKSEKAKSLGSLIAVLAKEKKITKVVFDRGAYAYHGRVKAVAEGAREGGLVF